MTQCLTTLTLIYNHISPRVCLLCRNAIRAVHTYSIIDFLYLQTSINTSHLNDTKDISHGSCITLMQTTKACPLIITKKRHNLFKYKEMPTVAWSTLLPSTGYFTVDGGVTTISSNNSLSNVTRDVWLKDKLDPTATTLNWNVNLDTTCTNLAGMFYNCATLKTITFMDGFDTSNVKSMRGMFQGCTNLETINGIKTFDMSSVEDISGMFFGCQSLKGTLDLQGWVFESNPKVYLVFGNAFGNNEPDANGSVGQIKATLSTMKRLCRYDAIANPDANNPYTTSAINDTSIGDESNAVGNSPDAEDNTDYTDNSVYIFKVKSVGVEDVILNFGTLIPEWDQ